MKVVLTVSRLSVADAQFLENRLFLYVAELADDYNLEPPFEVVTLPDDTEDASPDMQHSPSKDGACDEQA